MNKEVHQQLRTAQRQLLVTLAALRPQAPANTSAGSSPAEVPAEPAAQEDRSSRPFRKFRTGRR
jgi:hypothetical protein